MKIAVVDGFTANPGDLSFDALASFGEFVFYGRSTPEQVVERAKDAEIVVCNKVIFNDEVFDKLPNLKMIAVLGTGYNTVDTAAAKARGITVCNVPGYSTPSVAQHVFALLLEIFSHTGEYNESVKRGDWQNSTDYSYCITLLTELSGLTLGIVGFGAIGRKVAEIANAFGMNVLYNSRTRRPELETDNIRWAELAELFKTSDVISLHCPLFPETTHLINETTISTMKDGAVIINTARGPVIDEAAVAAALRSGKLGGAGVDVLDCEPPRNGSPLIGAPNCVVTPHVAWAPKAARKRLIDTTVKNIERFLAGNAQNVVNP